MATVSSFRELENRVLRASHQRELLKEQCVEKGAKLEALRLRLDDVTQAQTLFQVTAQETQNQIKFHVQALVQNALDAVFPATYIFKISFELRRGQTEVDIFLDKDGELMDPKDSCGGGVVDVIAFALRVVAWSLSRTSPVLILDEPFKYLSAGIRPVAGELLRGIADQLNLQIILVTHDPEFAERADRIFTVVQKRRRSEVTVQEGTAA